MSNITIEFPKEINRSLYGCNGAQGDWLKKNGNRVQLTWKPIERLHKIFNSCNFSHDYQICSTFFPSSSTPFSFNLFFNPFSIYTLCISLLFFLILANSFYIYIFVYWLFSFSAHFHILFIFLTPLLFLTQHLHIFLLIVSSFQASKVTSYNFGQDFWTCRSYNKRLICECLAANGIGSTQFKDRKSSYLGVHTQCLDHISKIY